MFWIIAVLLAAIWTTAMASSHTAGGTVHLLLLVSMGLVITKIIQSRKTAQWLPLSPKRRLNDSKAFMLSSKFHF